MKSLLLLFQQGQFSSPQRPEQFFSVETFREECRRQDIAGKEEVYLQVVYHVPHFIVLPKDIDEKAIYIHHFPENQQLPIDCQPLGDKLQKMVYPVDESLAEAARETLPRHRLLADAYLLANYALQNSRKKEVMILHWLADDLQVFIAANGQLQFANSFKVHNDAEVQYFIAAVAQEYGLSEQVMIGGNARLESLIKDHFKQIGKFSIAKDIQTFLQYQSPSL